MSWLKKLFSLQSSSQSSSQSTSEGPKLYYSMQISTKTEEPKKETTDVISFITTKQFTTNRG